MLGKSAGCSAAVPCVTTEVQTVPRVVVVSTHNNGETNGTGTHTQAHKGRWVSQNKKWGKVQPNHKYRHTRYKVECPCKLGRWVGRVVIQGGWGGEGCGVARSCPGEMGKVRWEPR